MKFFFPLNHARNFEPAFSNGSRQAPNQSVVDYYNDVETNQINYCIL